MKSLLNIFAVTVMTGILASATSSIAGTDNGTARGGATELLKGSQLTTDNTSVTPAPTTKHAMHQACPACKTTWSTTSVAQSKRSLTETLPVEHHQCGDCKTSLTTVGHGKDKKDVITHTCQAAAAKTASCCGK